MPAAPRLLLWLLSNWRSSSISRSFSAMILSVRATISSIFNRRSADSASCWSSESNSARSRRFWVSQSPPLSAAAGAAAPAACRPGLGLRQLPLKLGVAGLQVADVVHRHLVTAGSILRRLGLIAFRRPCQEFRPQAFIARLQCLDLGLQGLDLAGEVGRHLPPTIALRLEELPHAGMLGLQRAGELVRPDTACFGWRACFSERCLLGGGGRLLAVGRQGRPLGVCRKGIAGERIERDERRLKFHGCAARRQSVSRGRRSQHRGGQLPAAAQDRLWTYPAEMSLPIYRPQVATLQTFCATRSGCAGGRDDS